MTNTLTQKQKAETLLHLHHTGKSLILPNIWEPLGALMMEDMGFPVVATSSSAIALTNGMQDGEKISFRQMLVQLERIAGAVSVPVTADIESGYADDDHKLKENIEALIDAGIVGINFEDSDKTTGRLIPVESQCQRIGLIKQVAERKGIPLFINARIDTYTHGDDLTSDKKLEETLKRGRAYSEAGAGCIFPILIRDFQHIKTLIDELKMPVNVMVFPGIPELKTLQDVGVARISIGSSLLKVTMEAMQHEALKLKELEGLQELTENKITSGYLQGLIDKGISRQQS